MPTPKGSIDKDVNTELSQKSVISTLKQYSDLEKECLKKLFETQPFTIINDQWPGTDFLDANYMGGRALLKYNIRHEFHIKIGELMKALEDTPEKAKDIADSLKTLIDLTFISFAKAETMFSKDDRLTADQFIEHLRSHWGKYLQIYVQSWDKGSK